MWLPFTAEQFQERVLANLRPAASDGLKLIQRRSSASVLELRSVPLVSALAENPTESSEFLLGEEPIWADIQAGRAVARNSDEELWRTVRDAAASKSIRGVVVVTGTAGSGKSTALMRVCLRLSAEGHSVGWVDEEGSLSPHEIRIAMRDKDAPFALAIDDADMYGSELSSMLTEICRRPPYPVVIVGVRAGRLDSVVQGRLLADIRLVEFSMPPLADGDIDALLDVLTRENRLGLLRGKNREEQRALMRDQAGRQLLVAMIQATSGRRFEERAVEELGELGEGARPYGLIAVASAYRFGLQRNEILLGLGESSNTVLNSVDTLLRRHVIRIGHDGGLWARHRVIAEVVTTALQKTGQIKELLHGLAHVAATQVMPTLSRSARSWRLLR